MMSHDVKNIRYQKYGTISPKYYTVDQGIYLFFLRKVVVIITHLIKLTLKGKKQNF